MLDDEVTIEHHGLDSGEQGGVSVDVSPAGLNQADLGVGEVVNSASQEIGLGEEVGVKDGDELPGGVW